jgi:uncharacterized phiE125 gp8 family phage protein
MGYLSSVSVTTAPSVEPVTAAEVKLFSKIDFSDDDTLLTIQIKSARQMVEKYLNKTLIDTTLKAYYTNYNQRVWLPYGPHQSVTSVTRKRRNESTTLTVNTDYYLLGDTVKYLDLEPTGIINPPGLSRDEQALGWDLEVVFVAGYGAASTDIPQPIKEAILKTIETNYDMRGNLVVGLISSELPNTAKALINSYRTPTI